MSFQITVLKVLAGHPEGRATLADLTRYVSVLISSGSDWTNRTKCLAALAPKLDIFGDSFVLRDDHGWRITKGGRQFLASLETPAPIESEHEQAPKADAAVAIGCSYSVDRNKAVSFSVSTSGRVFSGGGSYGY